MTAPLRKPRTPRRPLHRSRRAFAVAISGIALHAGAFVFLTVEPPEPPRYAPGKPFVRLAPDDGDGASVLRESSFLFDTAPLLFPTDRNAGNPRPMASMELDPVDLFGAFPAEVRLEGSSFALPDQAGGPDGPATLLPSPLETVQPFTRLAEPVPARELPPAVPMLAIVVLDPSGNPVLATTIAMPVGEPAVLWKPPAFFLQVTDTGWVGPPLTSESSGFPEWDGILRNAATAALARRSIPAGYYRVTCSPQAAPFTRTANSID